MKRIVVIEADGTERELSKFPTYPEMKIILGGWIEHVVVLDRIAPSGAFIYTSMYVREEGLLDNLPRNEKATELYQRNVRAQFPDDPNPFRAANVRFQAEMNERGFEVIDGTPWPIKAAGYGDDPWIAGPAIYFEGWTVAEVDAVWERTRRGRNRNGRTLTGRKRR